MSNKKVAIIGSGPSGLTAGIYTSRANLDTTIFLGMQPGGQLTTTTELENFPGAWSADTKEGMMGPDLMQLVQQQAEHFGAKTIPEEVRKLEVTLPEIKVLFATNNPSKIKRYQEYGNYGNAKLITLNDLQLSKIPVVEDGATELDNAKLKAEAFFHTSGVPSLALDTGLYFDGVADSEQPSRFVQRIAGSTDADDAETRYTKMTDFYITLAKKYGGTLCGYFLDAFALYDGKQFITGFARRECTLRDRIFGKEVDFPVASLYTVRNKPYHDLNADEMREYVEPSVKALEQIINQHKFNYQPKFSLGISNNTVQEFDAVIIASGASAKYLGIAGEENFIGKGYHSCATCDGFFYRKKTICVVGGGDSAMEEANFLTKFAEKVYLIHRSDKFKASKIMYDRAKANPKIEFLTYRAIAEFVGTEKVTGVMLKNLTDDTVSELVLDGVFVAIGHTPNTAFIENILDKDQAGYLQSQHLMPTEMRTSKFLSSSTIPGIFIAGDVADQVYRQAITAAGEGCRAAIDCERWLEGV